MSINNKCPSCGAIMPDIEGQQVMTLAGGVVLWRGCDNCGYKWREAYKLQLIQSGLPWTKPPEPGDNVDEDEHERLD